MMRPTIVLAVALLAAPPAMAASVAVQVVDAAGVPVAGAVITLAIPGTPPPSPAGTYSVAQRNIAFDPHVLIVPVGATVGFPNFDRVRHHVYSFSKAKRFDLKLYGREDSRSVVFDKPGAVTLGCNIHDAMSGVVFVTDTPFAAVTDAAGRVRLAAPAAARATLAIWAPTLRTANSQIARAFSVPATGVAATITLPR